MEEKAHKVVNKVFNIKEYNKALFEDKYDLVVLHVFDSSRHSCCPAILPLARRFPDVSFCIADANCDQMKFLVNIEPIFVLYSSNNFRSTFFKQGVDGLQGFVTKLSNEIESHGFKVESPVEHLGVIDVSKYTADEREEKKTLKNVFHQRGAAFLDKFVKDNVGFALNFKFDSSLDISRSYIEVINTLAEKHPEIKFLSSDMKGVDKNPFSSSSVFRLGIDAYYNNTSIGKQLHMNLFGCSRFLSSSYEGECDERNFVFASSGKEAASVVESSPAVLAFVYDKDDEEYICSEGVLFNNVHDLSLLHRRVVFLLVEKSVANSGECPKELCYVDTPTCTAYLNGAKLNSTNESFESLERAIVSIKQRVQVKEEIRPLKELYRGNFLFYLI